MAELENTRIVRRIQNAQAAEEERRRLEAQRAAKAAQGAKSGTPRGRSSNRSREAAAKRHSSMPGVDLGPGSEDLEETTIVTANEQTPKSRVNRQGSKDSTSKRGLSVPAGKSPLKKGETKGKCDKCDGPHETDQCPHFRKIREKHKDAWSMLGKAGMLASRKEVIVKAANAKVVPQPGDGTCLFHSLSYGLKDGSTGPSLRKEICEFIQANPDLEIGDNALKDWVKYDGGGTVSNYIKRMKGSNWGGGIEMAAATRLRKVNVHVYEKCSGGYRRISAFELPGAVKTVSVVYGGRAHYDALVL